MKNNIVGIVYNYYENDNPTVHNNINSRGNIKPGC